MSSTYVYPTPSNVRSWAAATNDPKIMRKTLAWGGGREPEPKGLSTGVPKKDWLASMNAEKRDGAHENDFWFPLNQSCKRAGVDQTTPEGWSVSYRR